MKKDVKKFIIFEAIIAAVIAAFLLALFLVDVARGEGMGRVIEDDVVPYLMEDGSILIEYTVTIENLLDEPLAVFFVSETLDKNGTVIEERVFPYPNDITRETLQVIPPYSTKRFELKFIIDPEIASKAMKGKCWPIYMRVPLSIELFKKGFTI